MAQRKGSAFERQLCKQLSEWWTGGKRDDVFWRTAASGGRATVRAAKGKRTALQQGDISAIDPSGAPLLRCLTFELKRGYKGACPFDLLDGKHTKTHTWFNFLKQAERQCMDAGSAYWAIVFKRDNKQVCVAVPTPFWKRLRLVHRTKAQEWEADEPAHVIFTDGRAWDLTVCRLADFLQYVKPEWFTLYAKELV